MVVVVVVVVLCNVPPIGVCDFCVWSLFCYALLSALPFGVGCCPFKGGVYIAVDSSFLAAQIMCRGRVFCVLLCSVYCHF